MKSPMLITAGEIFREAWMKFWRTVAAAPPASWLLRLSRWALDVLTGCVKNIGIKRGNMNMTKYVVGFVFNKAKTEVCLIEKKRPEWQRNKFNGVGGHIEHGELPHEAMQREFFEETGIQIEKENWKDVIEMYREGEHGFSCRVYRHISDFENLIDMGLVSMTDEEISIHRVKDIGYIGRYLSNVPWLVLMCVDTNPGDFENYLIIGQVGK